MCVHICVCVCVCMYSGMYNIAGVKGEEGQLKGEVSGSGSAGFMEVIANHILNPLVRLSLRIDEQRPAFRVLYYDPVLDAQNVSR